MKAVTHEGDLDSALFRPFAVGGEVAIRRAG